MGKSRLKLSIAGICGSIVLLLLACTPARKTGASAEPAPAVDLDDRLARIRMRTLDGKPFSLQNSVGKPVFLNFWATWCRPCVSEMESIEAAYSQYKNDIVFIAVSPEEPAKIRDFQKAHPFSFQFAQLDMTFLDAFVVKLPTTLLIDRAGKLVSEEEGLRIWTQYNNLEKIKALAKQP